MTDPLPNADRVQGEELDQLFSLVERRPFAEDFHRSIDPGQDINSKPDIPREGASIAQDALFPPMVQSLLDLGVPNGNFMEGPEEVDTDLDDEFNKLPGWELTIVQGTSITVQYSADAAARNGFSLKFVATNATNNDEIYLETVVAVNEMDRFLFPAFRANRDQVDAKISLQLRSQFLDSDLATTGSEISRTLWSGDSGNKAGYNWRVPPADAVYLRLRIAVKCTTTGHATTTTDLVRTVWTVPPEIMWVSFAVDNTTTMTAGGTDYMNGGASGAANSIYIAPKGGFCYAAGGRLSTAATSNQCALVVEDQTPVTVSNWSDNVWDAAGASTNISPQLDIDGRSAGDFDEDDRLRVALQPDSGPNFAPLTADSFVVVTFMMYDEPSAT